MIHFLKNVAIMGGLLIPGIRQPAGGREKLKPKHNHRKIGGTKMIQVRRGKERGPRRPTGWLNTYHTIFIQRLLRSESRWGFRSLRVINEDWVQPGYGFSDTSAP